MSKARKISVTITSWQLHNTTVHSNTTVVRLAHLGHLHRQGVEHAKLPTKPELSPGLAEVSAPARARKRSHRPASRPPRAANAHKSVSSSKPEAQRPITPRAKIDTMTARSTSLSQMISTSVFGAATSAA